MAKMVEVTSSNVEAIGYDEGLRELAVRFKSGGTYVYHDVPKSVFDDFLESESKGRFIANEIKNQYDFTKR